MNKTTTLRFALITCVCTLLLFSHCTTKKKDSCSNGILDGVETEIDCGGASCTACPTPATLSATLSGLNYNASTINCERSGSHHIQSYGGSTGIDFSFTITALNTPLPVSDGNFFGGGDGYYFQLGDTGTVVVTAHDEVKKIISGRFSFSGTSNNSQVTKSQVQSGRFDNVRYTDY